MLALIACCLAFPSCSLTTLLACSLLPRPAPFLAFPACPFARSLTRFLAISPIVRLGYFLVYSRAFSHLVRQQTESGKTFTTFSPGAVAEIPPLNLSDAEANSLRAPVPRVPVYHLANISSRVKSGKAKVRLRMGGARRFVGRENCCPLVLPTNETFSTSRP